MDVGELRDHAARFSDVLADAKRTLLPEADWYPYSTLGNVEHLDRLLEGRYRDLLDLAGGLPVADIGAADGDLAWLLASFGHEVDIIEYGPTNFNQLRGARALQSHFAGAGGGAVDIVEVDLDAQFRLPRPRYGLVFFLGILYHLQNPFYALKSLAEHADYVVLSTRVAQRAADGTRLADLPVAYLLDAMECNDDPSNYWILSPTGLRRLLDRTGWTVVQFATVGCTTDSEPARPDRDERAFCLLQSRRSGDLGDARIDAGDGGTSEVRDPH